MIFIALVAFLGVVFFKYSKMFVLLNLKIPNWETYPFPVYLLYPLVKLAKSSPEERFQIMGDLSKTYPDLLKVWLGPKLLVWVNSPERIQKVILSPKCQEKWVFLYHLMERPHGLIAASTKNKWKQHRKFFNSSFSQKALESFLPKFSECSANLCDDLMVETKNNEFDFFIYAEKCAFDILCATTLGTSPTDRYNEPFYENLQCF